MQLMFCNTYHLLLQPGPAPVAAAGGLHAFISRRNRPLITDSGGFQIFSLQHGGVAEELAAGAAAAGGASLKRAAARHIAVDGESGAAPSAPGASGLRRNAASGVVKCVHCLSNAATSAGLCASRMTCASFRARRVTEEGVTFRSYRDGARVVLTPESSVAAQKARERRQPLRCAWRLIRMLLPTGVWC